MLRIQENITFRGLFIDPIPNSPNSHNKNCMAEIKEITNQILIVKGLVWKSPGSNYSLLITP